MGGPGIEHARLPAALRLSISRLLFKQIAYLVFAGIVFESVFLQCGLRQGAPLRLHIRASLRMSPCIHRYYY